MFQATPPKKLPIDLERIETHKGRWLVAVETVTATKTGENLLLKIILERFVDDEHFQMRHLGMLIKAHDARDPESVENIANRIRGWIELTEGDGFMDIVDPST
jgi:hypothetical protein